MPTRSTLVSSDISIVPARAEHAGAIAALVNAFADRKLMLRREAREVLAMLDQFHVALCDDGRVVGCACLTAYPSGIVEIRSLCVAESHHGGGLGSRLTLALVDRARAEGRRQVLAVTKSPGFFERLGFVVLRPEGYPDAFLDVGIRAQRRTLRGKCVMSLEL